MAGMVPCNDKGCGTMFKKLLGQTHEKLVFNRRVAVLIDRLGRQTKPGTTMLDVGTGDGQIAKLISEQSQDVTIRGIDIMRRGETHIPVDLFDGKTIPQGDGSVDTVMFVDVLHHTDDPAALISEAARVARQSIIIKDHLSESWLDHMILRFMDWVGNAPHGVVLPYNYAPRRDWQAWFSAAKLDVETFETDVPLYPFPFNMLFGRKLHFIARLTPQA